MKRLTLIFATLLVTGCGVAGFVAPLISPLLNEVIDYVVGETTEGEFLKDLVEHSDDPVQVVWEQANRSLSNPQSKYILGATDSLGVVDRIVGLTFRDSVLYNTDWVDPDTTFGQ